MRILFGLVCLITVNVVGQTNTKKQLDLETIIKNIHQDPKIKPLVFSQSFDGINYSDGNPLGIQSLTGKMWKVLDTTKQKINKLDRDAITKALLAIKSKKIVVPKNGIRTDLFSNEHKNLVASNMVVEESTTREQINEMIKQRINLIKSGTPIEKQIIYQFSEPYYYNQEKQALLIFLTVNPGKYDFYLATFNLIKNKWTKDKVYLFTAQPN